MNTGYKDVDFMASYDIGHLSRMAKTTELIAPDDPVNQYMFEVRIASVKSVPSSQCLIECWTRSMALRVD